MCYWGINSFRIGDFMTTKQSPTKKGIDKLIQEHEGLFDAWKSHREKTSNDTSSSEDEAKKDCNSESATPLDLY
jgi:hypothetical protein